MIRPALLLLALTSACFAQAPASATAAGKFPALNVQVAVGTQQRAEKGSFYRKTMNIEPKITIEGPSRLVGVPAVEATMLIITMDTRAKYKENNEVFNVYTAETIQVPAAATGERRQFEFSPSSVTFDAYRDNSNVGGEVYKYYVFGLRDVATKQIVDFKTNNPPLLTYIKAHPEKRKEFLSLTKGSRFPAVFK